MACLAPSGPGFRRACWVLSSRDRAEVWPEKRYGLGTASQGVLGVEFDKTDRAEVQVRVRDAEEMAREEVWAGYRFAALADTQLERGLKVIDLGAGHSSGSETLCGRVIAAMKSEALLNESVGAGYIERHWPPTFKDAGAWPLTSLRQSFLNGALTRLIDPDAVLRRRIVEFVAEGDFGLASGDKWDGHYERLWFAEPVGADEVAFESGVFLLTKSKAEQLHVTSGDTKSLQPGLQPGSTDETGTDPTQDPGGTQPGLPIPIGGKSTLRLRGTVPPELWNRLGTKILPKLRSGDELIVGVEISVSVDAGLTQSFQSELRQALDDLGLRGQVSVDAS